MILNQLRDIIQNDVGNRGLRKDPERRWQAIADIKVALRELKDESDSGGLALPAAAALPPRPV